MAQQQAAVCTQVGSAAVAAVAAGGSGCPGIFPCSSSAHALLPQVHPPTAVTHCTSAWLTRPPPAVQPGRSAGSGAAAASFPDLVVLRSTQLEVYRVCTAAATPGGAAAQASAAADAGSGEEAASLALLCSCQLFGVAESMAVLQGRVPGRRDALMLTFRRVVPRLGGGRLAGPLLLQHRHASAPAVVANAASMPLAFFQLLWTHPRAGTPSCLCCTGTWRGTSWRPAAYTISRETPA